MDPLSELKSLPLLVPTPPARRALEESLDQLARAERRVSPRVPVELMCEEWLGPCRSWRRTSDLSVFGLSTRSRQAHPLGTPLRLQLHLPDDPSHPLRLNAEVVGLCTERPGVR